MNPDNSFQLTLTAAELYWLAGAFGKTVLLLPGDPWRDIGPAARTEALSAAPQGLDARGFIRRKPGTGWVVDSLPAILIQWLAEPESILKIERKNPDGENAEGWFYVLHKNSLWLECKSDGFHLTLFRDPADAAKQAIIFSSIPEESAPETSSRFRVPQPEVFLSIAWNNPQKARIILQQAETDGKEIAEKLDRLQKLDNAVIITHLVFRNGKFERQMQSTFLVAQECVWGTNLVGSGQADFQPLDSLQVKQAILATIEPIR